MFEALLKEDFRGLPGELNVALNRYQFLGKDGKQLLIKSGEACKQAVKPRARVYMSMVVNQNEHEFMEHPGLRSSYERPEKCCWKPKV